MNTLILFLNKLLQPSIVLLVIVAMLLLNRWIFKRMQTAANNHNITKGLIAFFLLLLGLLIFILSLPIDKEVKGQILGFLGIIFSAAIALSSTTVLGNLIAGIMNKAMNRFRNGDLISIDHLQGRVIKQELLHSEIQLEDSNFITIPNLYIAQQAVKLVRKSNTVISTEVSLGYDTDRHSIDKALKSAATAAGLKEPYVYIKSLGDFSVVYKIHGFLDDSSQYFSTNSLLNAMVMDHLHQAGIEIVSPGFVNQRRVDEQLMIPKKIKLEVAQSDKQETPEELVFGEAIASGKIENKKAYIEQIDQKIDQLKAQLKDSKEEAEKASIKSYITKYENFKTRIEKSIHDDIAAEEEDKK